MHEWAWLQSSNSYSRLFIANGLSCKSSSWEKLRQVKEIYMRDNSHKNKERGWEDSK